MASARLLHLLLALLLFAPVAGPSLAAAPATELTVAVVPIMPPLEIKRRWQPVLDQIGRDSGLVVRFRFFSDYAGFEQALARGEPDFAVTSPLQVWRLRSAYRPLLRGGQPLAGLVVVRRDSPLRQLADLQGRRLAVQKGSHTTSGLLVERALREHRVTVHTEPLNTESSALRSVVRGRHDAAVINNYLLGLLPPEIAGQIRIIHRTPELPPPAISAGVHVPPELALRYRRALLRLRDTHPALLEAILMPDLTEADFERDYGGMGRFLSTEASHGAP